MSPNQIYGHASPVVTLCFLDNAGLTSSQVLTLALSYMMHSDVHTPERQFISVSAFIYRESQLLGAGGAICSTSIYMRPHAGDLGP